MYGERLKNARKKRNLSQEEVALELNISRSNISKYENEELEPNLQTLKELCKIYETSADYIIGLVQKPMTTEIKQQNNETTMININSKGE